MANHASINTLPDELLHCILCYTTPATALALEQTSKRYKGVTNAPILWRYYCLRDFRYWDKRHSISEKSTCPASQIEWKELCKTRHLIDAAITESLDSILSSQTGRIEKFQKVVNFGYDAKDTLLRHGTVEPTVEDSLARGYVVVSHFGFLARRVKL